MDNTNLRGPLSAAQLAQFAELLAGLVRAQVPLPQALSLLSRDAERGRVRETLQALEGDAAAGASLVTALKNRGSEFPPLFISLVESGIASNDLHAALVEIVRECRSQARFREALWTQLLTPVSTCIVFAALLLIMMIVNLPMPHEYVRVFHNLRIQPPASTRVLLFLIDIVHQPNLLAFLGAGVASLICLLIAAWRSASFRCRIQELFLATPVLGPFLSMLMLGRFCRISSILLRRGLPLHVTLALTRDSIGFLPLKNALQRITDRVAAGAALPEAIVDEPLFPATFGYFVQGARSHGDLPETLSRLAELYEDRSQIHGARVRMFVYVFSMLVMGSCVLWLTAAVFEPMFGIQNAIRRR